jgi:uncharacterized protein YcgI (DUF1989 family)
MPSNALIKASHANRIDLKAGQILEIVNVEGTQVCDFFAFNAANVREHLSPAHIRSALGRVTLRVGDELVSVLRRPMFTILEDTCGQNDFMGAPCDPMRYVLDFGVHDHRSCRANLADVMAPEKIPYEYLPDPINFFQNSPATLQGDVKRGKSPAKPGDKIVLRALMDLIAVGSACPQDLVDLNGFNVTDINLVVKEG